MADYYVNAHLNQSIGITFACARAEGKYVLNDSLDFALLGANTLPRSYDPANSMWGWLINGARTNYFARSADFTNAAWVKSLCTVAAAAHTSPFGANTGFRVTSNNTGNSGVFFIEHAVTLTGSTEHVCYAIVKAGTVLHFRMVTQSFTAASRLDFDLTTHATSNATNATEGGVVTLSGSWKLCWMRFTPGADATGTIRMQALEAAGDNTFTILDGTQTFDICHCQVAQGNTWAMPIVTTGSTASRSADVITAALSIPAALTLYARAAVQNPVPTALLRSVVSYSDGDASDYLQLAMNPSDDEAEYNVVTASVSQAAVAVAAILDDDDPHRLAAAAAAGDFILYADGTASTADAAGSLPAATTIYLGARYDGAATFLEGHLFEFYLRDSRRNNTDLDGLSDGTILPYPVLITNAGDETFNNGESVAITCQAAWATQGDGRVVLCEADSIGHASATAQTVTSWGNTSITITVVAGTLPLATTLYLFVENSDGMSNAAGYPVQLNVPVSITNAGDEAFDNGDSVVITGISFLTPQGDGRVVLSETTIDGAGAEEQTVTAWADTSITITVVAGSLPLGTGINLFVENSDERSNATPYVVQLNAPAGPGGGGNVGLPVELRTGLTSNLIGALMQ